MLCYFTVARSWHRGGGIGVLGSYAPPTAATPPLLAGLLYGLVYWCNLLPHRTRCWGRWMVDLVPARLFFFFFGPNAERWRLWCCIFSPISSCRWTLHLPAQARARPCAVHWAALTWDLQRRDGAHAQQRMAVSASDPWDHECVACEKGLCHPKGWRAEVAGVCVWGGGSR